MPSTKVLKTPPKKPKLSSNEVKKRISNISDALTQLDNRSQVCHQLLQSMTCYSLGPMANSRHRLQQDAARIVEAELCALRMQDGESANRLEKLIVEKRQELDQMLCSQKETEHEVCSQQGSLSDQRDLLASNKLVCDKALSFLDAAMKECQKIKEKLTLADKRRTHLQSIYKQVFLPVRDADSLNSTVLQEHISQVNHLMTSVQCEQSLLKSFSTAAHRPQTERGKFCQEVMKAVDTLLKSEIDKGIVECANLQQELNRLHTKRKDAQDAHANAKQSLDHANSGMATSRQALDASLESQTSGHKAVQDMQDSIKRLELELASVKLHMEKVVNVALEAYTWLLDHQVAGFEPPHPKESIMHTYGPEVRSKIDMVSKGLRSLSDCSMLCVDMLISCALHGLSPCPSERNTSQDGANKLVSEALYERKEKLQEQIDSLIPHVGELDTSVTQCLQQCGDVSDKIPEEKEAARSEASAIVTAREVKFTDLNVRQQHLHHDLRQARDVLHVCKGNLKEALQRHIDFDARYGDFMVLRDGAAKSKYDANRRLDRVAHYLEFWGLEDCLVAGFRQSALHRPSDRGPFSGKIVRQVEVELADLKTRLERDEQEFKVSEQNAAHCVKSLESELSSLAEECNRVAAERDAARSLLGKVQELEAFRSGPLSAFQWLLKRQAS